MQEKVHKPEIVLPTKPHSFLSSPIYARYRESVLSTLTEHNKTWRDEKSLSKAEIAALNTAIHELLNIGSTFVVALDTPSKLLRSNARHFNALIGDMYILPGICAQADVFTRKLPYEFRRGARLAMEFPEKGQSLVEGIVRHEIDAPLVFELVLKKEQDSTHRVISMVSAWPDFKENILYVDQIQGPWQDAQGNFNPVVRDARNCFELSSASPFAAMCILAERIGMSSIAIRDAAANWHESVAKKADSPDSLYTRTIALYQHFLFAGTPRHEGNYMHIPLPKRAGDLRITR